MSIDVTALTFEQGTQPDEGDIKNIRDVLGRYPRAVGRIAVEQGATDAVLLGILDGGVGLDGLLGAAEMHGEFGEVVDEALDSGRKVVIADMESGWTPQVV